MSSLEDVKDCAATERKYGQLLNRQPCSLMVFLLDECMRLVLWRSVYWIGPLRPSDD
jgi:hypothetical protein